MLGFTWAEIEEDYLQSKTANACIERHERLMMRRRANGWDSNKMETLAKEYVSMHEEIWSGLAARVGENWRVIEEKVCHLYLLFLHLNASIYLKDISHYVVHVQRPRDLPKYHS